MTNGLRTIWTPKKLERITEMLAENKSLSEIAESFGTTKDIVKHICRSHNIKFPISITNPPIVVTAECKMCKKQFSRKLSTTAPEPKFCSRKCNSEFRRTSVEKEYTCLQCKTKFSRLRSTNPLAKFVREPEFCSKTCQKQFERMAIEKGKLGMV